jgi:hypothetical protein
MSSTPPASGQQVSGRAKRRLSPRIRFVAGLLYVLLISGLLLSFLPGFLEAVFRRYEHDVDQPFSDQARRQYVYIKAHLEQPFEGYGMTQVLAPQFAVVALSHMGCGLMNVAVAQPAMKDQIAPLLGEVARRALSPKVSPYGVSPEQVTVLGSHGLYLSHLNLILGCYRHVSGDPKYDDLHQRITAHLAQGTLADGDFHIRSYPNSAKWPADQTVTLCSLYLYDQVHHTNLSHAPIQGWLTYMKQSATDPATQLPLSSISALSYARFPRGCALSWSSLYMAQFAPEDAARLYARYRGLYAKEVLGCGGFREWPPPMDGEADVDSGPIIFDIGVAASGLGLGPARLFQDRVQYAAILRAASVCGMPQVFGSERKYRLAPLLGEAILFDGVTATPWFAPVPTPGFPQALPFPTAPLILSIGAILVIAILVWRFRRRIL